MVKTLNELSLNTKAKIVGIKGETKLKIRLLEMGLVKGTIVKITKIPPLKDPLTIGLRGYELTLRLKDLSSIMVEIL